MILSAKPIVAVGIIVSMISLQIFPLVVLADEIPQSAIVTTSASTNTATSSAATSDATTTVVSSGSSESASSTNASFLSTVASSSTATSTNDQSIHATSTLPNSLTGSSTVSESVSNTASSSDSAFLPTSNSSTTAATSTNPATASSTLPAISDASSTPNASGSASTTLSVASSTQTIVTGSSVALANILNLLNATFINSTGAILFANLTGDQGSVDLRNGAVFAGLCGAISCGGIQGLQINLLNDAKILNDIFISANTGKNQIVNASSSAAIGTGDAFAGLNLINIENVTFANSNYLLVTLNAFQDVNGDIVFPGLQNFLNGPSGALANGSTAITNTANVQNNAQAAAQSGDNTLGNIASTSTIVTGSSDARVNIFNQINSLLMGNGATVLLRFSGNWNGEVQGLIPGVSVERSGSSALISGSGSGANASPLALGLNATSSADIANNTLVEAQSGTNAITDASSTALIHTGKAFAAANIINIANQTVIGHNWLLAIINVFGNFNGNIAFGRPDLWVGDSVRIPSFVGNGTPVAYSITLKNKGDAAAHDVQLHEQFDAVHLDIATSSVPFVSDVNGGMVFSLGTLAPGETRHVSYEATLKNTSPGSIIANTSTAKEHETDNNIKDNTDTTSFSATQPNSGSGSGVAPAMVTPVQTPVIARAHTAATIVLTRLSNTITITAGNSVTETIRVQNTGEVTANNVVLNDILKDPFGSALHIEKFTIGALVAGDGVDISYVFNFGTHTAPGHYTLASILTGDNVQTMMPDNGSIILNAPVSTLAIVPSTPITTTPSAVIVSKIVHATVTARAPTIAATTTATSTVPLNGIPRESLVAAAGLIDSPQAYKILAAFLVFVFISFVGRAVYRWKFI